MVLQCPVLVLTSFRFCNVLCDQFISELFVIWRQTHKLSTHTDKSEVDAALDKSDRQMSDSGLEVAEKLNKLRSEAKQVQTDALSLISLNSLVLLLRSDTVHVKGHEAQQWLMQTIEPYGEPDCKLLVGAYMYDV